MRTPRSPVAKGVSVGAGVFLALGVVTDLIPTPLYVRMVPRTPLDYLFLVATAVFAGAFVYQRSTVECPLGDGVATGGVVGGLLAFGCPVCNAVLLALFSSSAIMTYVDPLRPVLGTLSMALFAGVLYYQHGRGCETGQ